MENASKALIMAGGMLIALIIIAILVILFGNIGDVYYEKGESLTVEQLEKYNRKFAVYNNTKGLYGSELLSLANLVVDYDNRLLYGEDTNSEFYKENKIVVYVTLYKPITAAYDEDGNLLYEGLEAKINTDIEYIKNYNDGLEKQIATMEAKGWNQTSNTNYSDYTSIKSLLTELRSMPFYCDSSKTEYNKYGRISKMYFKQEL